MVRFVDSGDESDVETGDGLAPVTSLFGDRGVRAYPKTAAEARQALEDRVPAARSSVDSAPSPIAEPSGSWREGPVQRGDTGDTPGTSSPRAAAARAGSVDDGDEPVAVDPPTWGADPIDLSAEREGRARSGRGSRAGESADGGVDAAEAAERGLVKKLRARQLSVSEAKTYLGQQDLDAESVAGILDAFIERGYLDDARLAEQVVHAGVDRKGQGRQAIAQSLAKRGVPRDVADAALAELPDDDAERALEFARSKAGSMRGLERDVALRRLAGQLARRGYGGSAALNAARLALDETMRPSGRVRFEER